MPGLAERRSLSRNSVNTNIDSEIFSAYTAPTKHDPLRFLAGLVFTAVYWPLGVIPLLAASLLSAIFLGHTRRRELGQHALGLALGKFMDGLEFLGVIKVEDEELKEHAHMRGPLIIACNHPALWDALLVMRRFVQVSCIMKADIMTNPLLRSGALFAGFLPNAPRMKMIRKAVERLNSGDRLLLFPEGTRTRRERGLINEFRPGLALLAKHSGAPVLPVFITTDSPYLQKGWPIWRMPELPISISLKVGETIFIQPEERVRDFSERLEKVFLSRLS